RQSDVGQFAGSLWTFAHKDSKLADANATSTDAFIATPQQVHLYMYVLSNPLKYRDPDGRTPQTTSYGEAFEELKPDSRAHEISYGLFQLFAETDLSFLTYVPAVLSPITSSRVPLPLKFGYAVVIAPFAIVGAGAAGVVVHVATSVGHVAKGSVR